MSPAYPESREVPIDVLPPLPHDAALPTVPPVESNPPPLAGLKTFYHPASGVVILGVDILAFGPDMLTGFVAVPLMCVLSFLVTFPLVFLIQTRWGRDTRQAAFGKALAGAFLAGLPFSIAGTMFGAAVIALSGLPHHPLEMVRRLTSGRLQSK